MKYFVAPTVRVVFQLIAVSPLELGPFARFVFKPLASLRAPPGTLPISPMGGHWLTKLMDSQIAVIADSF